MSAYSCAASSAPDTFQRCVARAITGVYAAGTKLGSPVDPFAESPSALAATARGDEPALSV